MIDDAMVAKLDQARRDGASAADVLEALQKSGVPDPEGAFQAYANSTLPDGRKRKNVNLGDPAEWTETPAKR